MKYLQTQASLVPPSSITPLLDRLKVVFEAVRTALVQRDPQSQYAGVIMSRLEQSNFGPARKLVSPSLKYIYLIGIGGSDLGARAVYEALSQARDTFPKSAQNVRMFFFEGCDTRMLYGFMNHIEFVVHSPEEYLLIAVSKSGKTTETAANLELVYDYLEKKELTPEKRTVFISDAGSRLWEAGERNKNTVLEIPQKVGGRYSIFSAAGLFPLFAAGYDIGGLLDGAKTAIRESLESGISNSPAVQSALFLYYHQVNNKRIHDLFLFGPALESLGKWYRQLMGESIGKEKEDGGVIKRCGISPTVSIGSTDLHSVAQLYFSGPSDRTTGFVVIKKEPKLTLPEKSRFGLVEDIQGRRVSDITGAIIRGTQSVYQKLSLPFITYELDEVNEVNLGWFMQTKMIEMVLLAELMGVNPFDQPQVELYKAETRNILKSQPNK